MVELLLALLLSGCAPAVPASPTAGDAVVRLRPGDPLPALGADARIDRGLRDAAERLAQAATTPDARLTPAAVQLALEQARYPGVVRFVRVLGTAELPTALLDSIPRGRKVDVGWAWRDFANGQRWWVLGWAPRDLELDPVPAQLPLGGGFGVRVEGGSAPTLFLSSPSGALRQARLSAGNTRWMGGLDEAGPWRAEVVDGESVELLFTVRVGEEVPALAPLVPPKPVDEPVAAADRLYARLDALRAANGLPALERFATFEPLVREQAACLAAGGQAVHSTLLCPGVVARASQLYYPRGRYYENLAVADTAAEAWDVLLASPGHVANLLCDDCTHVTIGAAIEPVAHPRLVVVWELMRFAEGEPELIR